VTVTVVLADDQALVRRGFRLILEAEPDIEVVAEAEDGQQAIDAVRRHRPAVVLMDIQMPGLDGLEATRRILTDADSHTRVLILTTFERDDYVFQALQLGASGFLLKTAPPEDLITAVRVVARGEALLSPSVTRRVIQEVTRHHRRVPHSPELERLTQRELEVLRLVAEGLTNARDRREALCQRGDGQDPHVQRPVQAGAPRPYPGGDLRLQARTRGSLRTHRRGNPSTARRRRPGTASSDPRGQVDQPPPEHGARDRPGRRGHSR
jgi:DNA-binding NarL/FixJ family response regulator